MNNLEIELLLSKVLEQENRILDKPAESEWEKLRHKFNCDFSHEFVIFIELMSKWLFPGDIYNVSTGLTNGNDTIEIVYDHEINFGKWDKNMIPFYGIGNGDYFCINAIEGSTSKVYYYYEYMDKYDLYSEDFEEWLSNLPEFLE